MLQLSIRRFYFIFCSIISLGLTSCSTPKNSVYFRDMPDTLKYKTIPSAVFVEPIIQPDDILNISIQTIDPLASSSVNQGNAVGSIASSTNSAAAAAVAAPGISGFLVDKEGFIELPVIGKIKIAGLTTDKARDLIRQKADAEFNKPAVQVRFANYKITVIGEVARPATYTVPNEKVSVLDALGLAGDLTIYGKRENVLLIREQENKKELIRLNLNSSDLLSSPYFYLKQNDVLYIEPNKAKVAANNASRTQTIAIVGSIASVLIILISRL